MPSCASCKFALRVKDDKETAICRRYPPVITAPNQSSYPIVAVKRFWCGEHAVKDKA